MPRIHIVVGASRGIGFEFTTQLLARGDTVIATQRSPSPNLHSLKASLSGSRLTILTCDISNEESIKYFVQKVVESRHKGSILEGGVIDTLVLNAGTLQYPTRISEASFASLTTHLQTNTLGPLLTASLLLSSPFPSLTIRSLVFISSDSGSAQNFLSYEDGFGAYSVSKAALNQGVRHLAAEIARKKARNGEERTVVLALHPGEVNTEMAANVELGWEVKGSIGVEESVKGCLGVIGEKGFGGVDEGGRQSAEGGEEGEATFWTWDGRRYPW